MPNSPIIENVIQKHFPTNSSASLSYEHIGEGAWHEVYLLDTNPKFVLKIRKTHPYGIEIPFKPFSLQEEYSDMQTFYEFANQVENEICPSDCEFHVGAEQNYAVETYMGRRLNLAHVSESQALDYGTKLGNFYRLLHNAPLSDQLIDKINIDQLERYVFDKLWLFKINSESWYEFYYLAREKVFEKSEPIKKKLLHILEERLDYTRHLSIVNQDISPENLCLLDEALKIIDPRPSIDFGWRYAAYFIFCYRLLLPQLSDTARYKPYQFDQHKGILAKIADGFLEAYTESKADLKHRINKEYYLCILNAASEHYHLLKSELTPKQKAQFGEKTQIEQRLQLLLRNLNELEVL